MLRIVSIAIVSAGAFVPAIHGQEALRPCQGILSDAEYSVCYLTLVRAALLEESPVTKPLAKVVVTPSFLPEWSIEVHQKGGKAAVSFGVVSEQLWGQGGDLCKRRSRILRATRVERSSVEIPVELAQHLGRLWGEALLSAAHSRPKGEVIRVVVDGIGYHFTSWVYGEGEICGYSHSPEAETPPGRLVELTTGLRQLVESPLSEREESLRHIEEMAYQLEPSTFGVGQPESPG